MSLASLLKSFKEEDEKPDELSLSGFLQRGRLKLSKAKKLKPREMYTSFSPYNIGYGFCMRTKVAHLAGLTTLYLDVPTPGEQIIFDVGHKYHDMIQGYFWDIGALEGYFECLKCDYKWWDISPKNCPKCEAWRKYLIFREVPLVNNDYMVRGRCDGILNVLWDEVPRKDIFDIKSIQNKPHNHFPNDPKVYFEDLTKPLDYHVVQLMLYLWLAEIENGHMLYIAKSTQKIKSYHVKLDMKVLNPYLDIIMEAINWADGIAAGEIKELPPPCSAKKCECEKIIFRKEVVDDSSQHNAVY